MSTSMATRHHLRLRVSYALIYIFACACAIWTVSRFAQALFQGPEFASRFLFDVFYTSNGTGFERRLFWTGLSGVPVLALALLAPRLGGQKFAAAFAACLALTLLPALFYGYMDIASAEYYASRGVDTSMSLEVLLLNYWPTTLSLLCYAHIGIDDIIRSIARKKDAATASPS